MDGKRKSLPGAKPKGIKQGCSDRAKDQTRPKYNPLDRTSQDFEAYRRAVRRLFADAFAMLRQFPVRLRFSYYVDRNGCLRALSDGGAER